LRSEEIRRLRLAARTLIEWGAPLSSAKVKSFVRQLINIHPFAADLGVDEESAVMMLDEHGTVLWYLSETLQDSTKIEREQVDVTYVGEVRKFYELMSLWLFNEMTRVLRVARQGGVESSRGAITLQELDRVDRLAMVGDPPAIRVLIGLALPLPNSIAERDRQLTGAMAVLRERYPGRERRAEDVAGGMQYMVAFCSIVLGIFLPTEVVGTRHRITALALLLIAIFIGAMLTLFRRRLNKGKRDGFSQMLTYVLSNMSLEVKEVVRVTGVTDEVAKRKIGELALAELGRLFGTQSGILASVLRQCGEGWKLTSLGATKDADRVVVRQVLPIVRHPDINENIRREIIRWLFSVNIRVEDEANWFAKVRSKS
jgi:hypothetical protein